MTIGYTINALIQADLEMWDLQDWLYRVRKMSLEEFKMSYFVDEEAVEVFWKTFKVACDTNLNRNDLIDEVDEEILRLVRS